jgi:hypothetical protein
MNQALKPDPELIARFVASAGLTPGVARRIVEDVLAQHAMGIEEYVRRRHRELVAAGWKNPDIYEQLRREIARRLFKGPDCSARQIRRMIYG